METQVSGWILTTIAVLTIAVFLYGVKRALALTAMSPVRQKRVHNIFMIVAAAWFVLIGVLAYIGVFAGLTIPPKPMFTVGIGLIFILIFSFTPTGKELLRATPLHWLVFFQTFRILVELWFWYSYKTEVFPVTMTFEGQNFDIIAGGLAMVAGFLMTASPKQAKVISLFFNIAGILILANTIRAAITMMASPRTIDERILQIGQPHFIYLPSVLVLLAFGAHLLSLRQLSVKKS